jgi:hypothetical protein
VFVELCCLALDETGCLDTSAATISIDERLAGSEKRKVRWRGLTTATYTSDFGTPVLGSSRDSLFLCNDGPFGGAFLVDRVGASSGGSPCRASSARAGPTRTAARQPTA